MAYTARHADTDEIHNVALADPEADYRCLDCDEGLSYVRQHVRTIPSGGSTSVTAHFSHRGGGGGGGGCDGTGGGESDLHKRRKRDALQEAVNRFDAADYDTEVYVGDKRADALLTFDEPHEEWGKGLVIEYQHKNEGKDIAETEQHFARNEYSTVWLWEEQYTYNGEIPDIDLFGGRVYTPWPDAVPPTDTWPGLGHDTEKRREWARAYDRGLTEAVVEATIAKDWVLPTPRQYWKMKGWNAAFRNLQFESAADYRAQVAVGKHSNSAHTRVTFAPQIIDSINYRYSYWHSLFSPSKPYRGLQPHHNDHNTAVNIDIDIAPLIDRDDWHTWYKTGRLKAKRRRDSMEPPGTVFDDVQCHKCGNYQYAPNAGLECPNCDTVYDWRWNVRTDRVAGKNLPDCARPI